MDEALIDQSLSFQAFRSTRERFFSERAAEAALVRSARRTQEGAARQEPSLQPHPRPSESPDLAGVKRQLALHQT
jgi:hypothetical protein